MGEFEQQINEIRKRHYGHKTFLGQRSLSIGLEEIVEIIEEARQEFPQIKVTYDEVEEPGNPILVISGLKEAFLLLRECYDWYVEWFGSAEGGDE